MNRKIPGFTAESALVAARGMYGGFAAHTTPGRKVVPADSDDFCLGKSDGNYPIYPSGCSSKFIVCQNQHFYVSACAPGTVYYPEPRPGGRCDLPSHECMSE